MTHLRLRSPIYPGAISGWNGTGLIGWSPDGVRYRAPYGAKNYVANDQVPWLFCESTRRMKICWVGNLVAVKRPHSFLQLAPRDSETGLHTHERFSGFAHFSTLDSYFWGGKQIGAMEMVVFQNCLFDWCCFRVGGNWAPTAASNCARRQDRASVSEVVVSPICV